VPHDHKVRLDVSQAYQKEKDEREKELKSMAVPTLGKFIRTKGETPKEKKKDLVSQAMQHWEVTYQPTAWRVHELHRRMVESRLARLQRARNFVKVSTGATRE